MFGDNLLVSPVVEQGARQKLVYLPKGNSWIDYWTGEEFEGGQYIIKDAPLDICPIYIKTMSIISNGEDVNYIGEKDTECLNLSIYLCDKKGEGKYIAYNDDGESFDYKNGRFNEYEFIFDLNDNLNIKMNKNIGYENKYKSIEFTLHNFKNNKKVLFNENEVKLNNNKFKVNL